jgi:hypothetical protein
MPVSATAMVTQSRPFSCACRASMVMLPWSVNLLASQEVQQRLAQPHLVGMQRSNRSIAMNRDLVLVLRRQRLDGLDHVVDERCEREMLELQLHPPGLDLGEVENIVDQGQ